ncbi:hypothetical protein BG015_007379 [Linnemannia schmuckeri]|uniref:Uncharacterized protein n=1 Tax=Linnemannia schmuckeri TaxID=64567 RepID=A0A9P5S9M4_9FUNG|nr:hypothetical protein BG015_007379 [Linnemannia schmuckeri]
MPRNRKTSPRDKQPAASSKDIDVMDSSSDEDILLKAFDAWTYVFLHSYVSMTDPILQLKIEHDDLDYQWGRFSRGQEALDPDPKFRFLENHHILEFGLEENFIMRHDLAVMVRDLFMRDLDLTRLNLGFSSYIRMFRQQLDDSASIAVDDPGMYWKTLMQIVCLVIALCMRESQDMADYSPVEDLTTRWEQKTRTRPNTTVNLERISDSAMTWMFEIATQAAQDTNRLYGLYQNTLRLIIAQLEVAIQELSPPANEDGLVDNLMEIRDNQVASLHRNFERLGQLTLDDIDSDWFETHDDEVETVHEERRLEFPTLEDTELSGQDKDGPEEGSKPSGEVGDNSADVEERANGVDEKTDDAEGKTDKWSAVVKVEDEEDEEEEEEEEEPLKRRYSRSKQVYDPYATTSRGSASSGSSGQPRGMAISFVRPGPDNLAQASLLSMSAQNQIAKTQVQDSLHADLASTAAAAPYRINLQASTAQQSLTAQHTSGAQQTSAARQSEKQPMSSPLRVPSQTPPPDPVPKPERQSPSKESSAGCKPSTTTAPAAGPPAKSLLAPERVGVKQSEPDPFISIKKTKRVFKAPSESEFEDDDDNVPVRELKKKKDTKESVPTPPLSDNPQSPAPDRFQSTKDALQEAAKAMRQNSSNSNSSSSSSGSAGPSNRNGPPVISVSQILQNRSPPKEKRKYRPWSNEEVNRLMELAPKFLHDPTPGDIEGRKKRNVRWAQLKTYDERHGNVLKHRTQVNLKDKYREKTDEGQHRQEVIMINRAKADAVPQHKFSSSKRGF